MKVVLFLSALIGILLATSEFRGKNHADPTLKMFRAAYANFRGHDELQALLKRADSDEMKERYTNFEGAVQTVEDVNDNKASRFSAKLNFMSVMTAKETKELLNYRNPENTTESTATRRRVKRDTPASVNWLSRGAQPPVKQKQINCGSCWTYTAVSALEGNYYIVTGDLVAFSEQEYLDCVKEYYYNKRNWDLDNVNTGCLGGKVENAFDYTKDVGRMASLADFPYLNKDRDCNMKGVSNAMRKAIVTGYDTSMRGDDSKLVAAAAEGIVTVAIQAVNKFKYFRIGIFECLPEDGCDCTGPIDHSITVVAYTPDYWRCRNSWGPRWGDGTGYIKMSRAQKNICNLNKYALTPVVECRPGYVCNGWESNGIEYNDKGEEEIEADFDLGSDLDCGEIEHFGGLCVDLDDTNDQYAVLTSAGCSRDFCMTSKGYLKDQATDLCLTISDPEKQKYNHVVFGRCSQANTWETTEKGFRPINVSSGTGRCWHPNGGFANPAEDSKVVIYIGCDEDRFSFQIKGNICWEERAGQKFSTKLNIADSAGKKMTTTELNKAKELCMDTDGCTGLNYKAVDNLYTLSAAKSSKDSKKYKVFLLVPCEKSCDAGLQRCEDGECKEKCSEDDDDCPAGTIRCNNGVCNHKNMCT